MNKSRAFNYKPPYVFHRKNNGAILNDKLIALIPIIIIAGLFFKVRATIFILSCITVGLAAEAIAFRISPHSFEAKYRNAAYISALVALTLPVDFPLHYAAIGVIVAIILGERSFFGMGSTRLNPVLLARLFLMFSFQNEIYRWRPTPVEGHIPQVEFDALSGASPLDLIRNSTHRFEWIDILGINLNGAIGEISPLLVIMCGLYLVLRKSIDHRIVGGLILGTLVLAEATQWINPDKFQGGAFHLLAGGLPLTIFFIAIDPRSTPVTKRGRFIFGLGCAIITMLIRLWGAAPEGIAYAVLIMNILTPYIDKASQPRRVDVNC